MSSDVVVSTVLI